VSFAVGDDVMTSQCMLALIKDVSSIVKAVGAPLAPSLSVKTSYGGNFTPFTSGIGSPDDSEVVSPITIVSSDGQRPGSVAARKALIRSISAHAVAGMCMGRFPPECCLCLLGCAEIGVHVRKLPSSPTHARRS
jgi:hypothetical protein